MIVLAIVDYIAELPQLQEQLLPDLVRVFSERPSSKLGVNEKPIWMRTQVCSVKIFGSCGAIKSTDRRKDSHLL